MYYPRRVRSRIRLPLGATPAVLASCLLACNSSTDPFPKRPRKPFEAFCQAHVVDLGLVDIETDYLPHVVQCENGGAPYASLQAQAVAARSYLYYKLETAGAIRDGEVDQVYSCPGSPTREQVQAVVETSGQILTYKGSTLCAFFVAGARQDLPACRGSTDHYTERFVTHNWALSGSDVRQSPLGLVHPSNHQNRGCLSQWGSRCLATSGWSYFDILKFYYGADVVLEKASGPCILDSNRPPSGRLEQVRCDGISGWALDPDEPDVPPRIHVFFGGPPGSLQATRVVTRAVPKDTKRCETGRPCPYAFILPIPLGLRDGKAHSAHAVAVDSQGGIDATLEGSGALFRCGPPAPPLGPCDGVRRPLPSLDSLSAWQLTLVEDAAPMTLAEVSDYVVGPDLPEAPAWVRAPLRPGTPPSDAVWVVDTGTLRSVSPHALASWRVTPGSVRTATPEELSLPRGSSFPSSPFLVRSPDGRLYLIDAMPIQAEPW